MIEKKDKIFKVATAYVMCAFITCVFLRFFVMQGGIAICHQGDSTLPMRSEIEITHKTQSWNPVHLQINKP